MYVRIRATAKTMMAVNKKMFHMLIPAISAVGLKYVNIPRTVKPAMAPPAGEYWAKNPATDNEIIVDNMIYEKDVMPRDPPIKDGDPRRTDRGGNV